MIGDAGATIVLTQVALARIFLWHPDCRDRRRSRRNR
jgi:hypothetical protein